MLVLAERARVQEKEVVRLTNEATNLASSMNRLGEENFKLTDANNQMNHKLIDAEAKHKEAKANLSTVSERLITTNDEVRALRDNVSQAFQNGYKEAIDDFNEQLPAVMQKI